MTAHAHVPTLSTGTDYDTLAARFRPLFARIAEGSVERERERSSRSAGSRKRASAPCACRSSMAVRARR